MLKFLYRASFSKPGMLIADPFLGSGTVIIESIKRHLSCVGYELNPSAFYMSKFYEYSKNSKECRDDIINQAHNIIETNISKLSKDIPLFVKADTYRESYASLLSFAHNIKNIALIANRIDSVKRLFHISIAMPFTVPHDILPLLQRSPGLGMLLDILVQSLLCKYSHMQI